MNINSILKALMLSVFLISTVGISVASSVNDKKIRKSVLNQTEQLNQIQSTTDDVRTGTIVTRNNSEITANAKPDIAAVSAAISEPVQQPTVLPKVVPQVNSVSVLDTSLNVLPKQDSAPVKLVIPKSRVVANIMPVGITETGNLDVPPNYVDVGWYKFGPKPGEQGSAVLDGHVDNGSTVDGVFKHLNLLVEGDDIYVTMGDNKVFHYKVVRKGVYPTTEFPGQMVFHENEQAYLKIITCHGNYVPSIDTYDQRLIVTAVLVP